MFSVPSTQGVSGANKGGHSALSSLSIQMFWSRNTSRDLDRIKFHQRLASRYLSQTDLKLTIAFNVGGFLNLYTTVGAPWLATVHNLHSTWSFSYEGLKVMASVW